MIEDDEMLLAEVQASPEGDLRAFEQLIRRHEGQILANCRHLTGCPSDAEDLAQEVFVKAFFGVKKFEGRSTFKTWLNRIKVNHCFNFLTKKRRHQFVDLDEPTVQGDPNLQVDPRGESKLSVADEQARINHVLDSMPESLRVAVVLRDLDGLSYQEVADQLGVSLSAAKMRIKRGREEFRSAYAALSREEPEAVA